MSQTNIQRQGGYTIIEITIALAFIATLMIAVLTISMQLFSLYNKGVTIRDVNAVTRHLVRDMQDSIASSKSDIKLFPPATTDPVDTLKEASDQGLDYYNNSEGGRLCTGSYTYIWNYGPAFTGYGGGGLNGEKGMTQFTGTIADGFNAVRFIKVSDDNKSMCVFDATETDDLIKRGLKLSDDVAKSAVPVFGEGERGLVLYSFEITSPEELALKQAGDAEVTTNYYSNFYTITTIVGSSLFSDEYAIVDGTDRCRVDPDSTDTMREYCAVNEIEFVARSGQI